MPNSYRLKLLPGSDHISRLPPEILNLVLLNLNPKNLLTCERVSKVFKKRARDEALWRAKIREYRIMNWKGETSAKRAVIRHFKTEQLPEPRQVYYYTFREDGLI